MSKPKVEIYQHFFPVDGNEDDAEWGWRLKAGNGEIVATGEGHRDPQDAERAVRGVINVVLNLVGRYLDESSWSEIIVVVNDRPLDIESTTAPPELR